MKKTILLKMNIMNAEIILILYILILMNHYWVYFILLFLLLLLIQCLEQVLMDLIKDMGIVK